MIKPRPKANNLLLIIPFSFLIIFFYFPVIYIIQKAFIIEGNFSLNALVSVLSQSWQRHVILFTFKQALYSLLLTLVIGLPISVVFSKYTFYGKKLCKAIMMIPFVLPGITVALGFILFYGNSGYLNTFLSRYDLKLSVLYSLKAIVLAHAFYNVPVIVRIVGDTLESINPHLINSARTLGANRIQTFMKVILPCIIPSIISASILVFLYCFMSFGIVLVLGDIKFTTIEVNIYIFVKQFLETEKGIALSFIQIVFSLIMINLSFLYNKKIKKMSQLITSPEHIYLPLFKRINIISICSLIMIILFLIFIIAPLISIILYAFKDLGTHELNLLAYNPIIGSSILKPVLNSLILGTLVSLLSVILSLLFRISLQKSKYRFAIEMLILLPLGISGITFSLGYLFIFTQVRIPNNILLLIAQTIICLPFCYTTISTAIDQINPNIIYAAQSLGAKSKDIFYRINLPLIYKAIFSSAMFSFAISLGEISSASMLQDNFITIPLAIYRFISARNFFEATNMSIILILTALIVFFISEKLKEER